MSSDDKSWVFDSLVGFLKGPMWNGPILSFIEQKSLFFEAGESMTAEHKKIHDDYKNLVDYMLGTYMDEMGITPAEFESACCEPSREIEAKLHQTLFEQIWAANDEEIFHRMMVEKNLDLQLQALEMIHNRFGITPQSFVLNISPKKSRHERSLEKQFVKLSLDSADAKNETSMQRLQPIEEAQTSNDMDDHDGPSASSHNVEERRPAQVQNMECQPEVTEAGGVDGVESITQEEEDIQKRKDYLKSQRDKIVEMKRQERESALKSSTSEGEGGRRPMTADAAESLMTGNFEINPKTLELRKALARRLKEEVIKKSNSFTD